GTMTDDDRQMIQTEVEGLQDEITRIVSTTEFNGQTLLDGTFDLKGYTDNVDVKVVYYGDALGSGEYTIGGDL
ncbi:flagellin FliC3, partial [Klebsiella oxytoca]